MSADDFLDRATRALRETDGVSSDAGRTRARLVAATARSGRRARLGMVFLPIAAVLAVSTAWADTHGWLEIAWARVEGSFASARPASPVRAVAQRAGEPPPAPPPRPTAAERAPVPPEVPVVPLESLPRIDGPVTPSHPTSPPLPTPASPPPPAPEDEADRLYAAAHRAHFVERDPPAALRAWDAYLLAAPQGSFAPEARYNRAITLIRLGRSHEARDALTPFAEGAYGTYRVREARELLAALPGE